MFELYLQLRMLVGMKLVVLVSQEFHKRLVVCTFPMAFSAQFVEATLKPEMRAKMNCHLDSSMLIGTVNRQTICNYEK